MANLRENAFMPVRVTKAISISRLLLMAVIICSLGRHQAAAQGVALDFAVAIGGVDADQGHDIAVDGSGNVYTTGEFGGAVDFDPGDGTAIMTADILDSVFISKFDSAGNFVWARSIGGTGVDHRLSDSHLALDVAGNVYLSGRFWGAIDFDPGPGVELLTGEPFDTFILKLDSAGSFVWARHIHGERHVEARSIAADFLGNSYITGEFEEVVDFDPGPEVAELGSPDMKSMFVLKLDAAGNYVWAKAIGERIVQPVYSYGIAVDDAGSVYTTGRFNQTVDFDPGPGVVNLTSDRAGSAFVCKLDWEGELVWAVPMIGFLGSWGFDIAADGSGNVFMTGNTEHTVEPNVDSVHDILVQKLDFTGQRMWLHKIGEASARQRGHGIATDESGNAYITGFFEGTVDFDPGPGENILTSRGKEDIFISKLDSDGRFVWAHACGDYESDSGVAVAVDRHGGVYTTGRFLGTADFEPGPGVANLTSNGSFDAFVSKFQEVVLAPEDINGDSASDAADVQLVINAALGIDIGQFDGDVNDDEATNAQDVQLVINAVLGL
jgi:hypothetical protein